MALDPDFPHIRVLIVAMAKRFDEIDINLGLVCSKGMESRSVTVWERDQGWRNRHGAKEKQVSADDLELARTRHQRGFGLCELLCSR